jgi:thiamine kinase-like enzyme
MKLSKCSSCGASIVWLKTAAGKNMPVDAETVGDADQVYELGKHKPHWASCPNANQHRTKKNEPPKT